MTATVAPLSGPSRARDPSPQDAPHKGSPPAGLAVATPMPDVIPARKRRGPVWGYVRRNPTIVVGGILLLIVFLMALLAPYLGTVDPTALAPAKRTRVPSAQYWFGTDMLGRDIYSRVVYGARVSLLVGFSVALLASVAEIGRAHV